MLARLQKFATFSLLAFVLAWLGYFLARGAFAWATVGPAIVVVGYAGVLALEFCLLYRSYPQGAPHRPRFGQLARACVSEAAVAPCVFLWRQPFRSKSIPDAPEARASPPRRGVVFVHGFVCNRGLWNPWLLRMDQEGVPFVAVTLEPVFGSIDLYVDAVEEAVDRLSSAAGRVPVIVAHSMGGLAVRAWLARTHRVSRFHRVVTIATPHHGTQMARHSHTANGRQMRFESPWLNQLARAESKEVYARFTCYWSPCDNIVFPTASATLPGADNRCLEATPHVRMAYHPAVVDEVLQLTLQE